MLDLWSEAAASGRGPQGRRPSSHLALVVSDLLVELLALQTKEVFVGKDDATLGCDGTGGVNVVSGHHTHRDACTLALGDGFRDLQGHQRGS